MSPSGPDAGAGVVDAVLAALADTTRRDLLDALSARGQATATTLAEDLPVSRQAVVKHLAVLDVAGLVGSTKVGREVRFSVRPDALDTTARWMAALAADWDRRLSRIRVVAEAAERDGDGHYPARRAVSHPGGPHTRGRDRVDIGRLP